MPHSRSLTGRRPGGGAAALLRGDDPGHGAAAPDLGAEPPGVRPAAADRAEPFPRRDPAGGARRSRRRRRGRASARPPARRPRPSRRGRPAARVRGAPRRAAGRPCRHGGPRSGPERASATRCSGWAPCCGSDGAGDDLKLTVSFAGVGAKRLVARYAGLELVERVLAAERRVQGTLATSCAALGFGFSELDDPAADHRGRVGAALEVVLAQGHRRRASTSPSIVRSRSRFFVDHLAGQVLDVVDLARPRARRCASPSRPRPWRRPAAS